ncbi:MAG: hypothetical protein VYE22_19705 [Myxococcota bacterium]|nr:hypothetical protein [Myxococcota bacterium]
MSAFPSVQAYLERLPDGPASYPECQLKAAVFVNHMDENPLPDELLSELPPAVVDLARNPPPVSAWIPEAAAMVYLLAIRDHFFAPGVGDGAYESWSYERNKRLLSNRLYRAVFLLVSPDRLFRHIGGRWARMRRGTSIEVLDRRPGYVHLQTQYPPHLHEESVAIGFRGAFRAAAELAGGKRVRIDPPSVAETSTEFVIRYE